MATKGDVLSARIKQRPILSDAARARAEFEDPFAMSVDFGRNLLEGWQGGEAMIEKGERYLDRQARKKEIGETSKNFKDFEEYKFYQGLSEASQEFYQNPTRVEKGFTELEARIPTPEGNSLLDNKYFAEARGLIDRDIAKRNETLDYSDPNRTDAILDAEYEAAKNVIGPKLEYSGYNSLNIPLNTTMVNIKNIIDKPYSYLYGKEPIQEAIASYRRPNIMLPQGTVVSR